MTDRDGGAMSALDRRALLGAAAALGTFLLDPRGARAGDELPPVPDTYPSQDPVVVREVVAVSHARLDRLRELVAPRPELANAAWDWGFGDWETALGAASHMGRRDIAAFLLEQGARPDVFTAAMLGDLAGVRGAIETTKGLQRTRGPHGLTLLAHARAGGDAARPVVLYLEGLGDADPSYENVELTPEQTTQVQGAYVFGPGANDRFVIEAGDRGGLMVRRGEGTPRPLFHLGGLEFHPSGAPSARIRVDLPGGTLEIRNPDPVLAATRLRQP